MGNMIKEWVIFNKLEDFNSFLKYTDDDFTPIGNLCYIKENGEMLITTTLQEFYNLIFNISLMKMNINMMTMSGPIL